jgi:Uma2 family endonuclease
MKTSGALLKPMITSPIITKTKSLLLNIQDAAIQVSTEQFDQLRQRNPSLQIASGGELITSDKIDVRDTTLSSTPEQFEQLCIHNPDLRLELTKDGELIVMTPAGGDSSEKNGELYFQVAAWNKRTQLGRVFESSAGYDLTAVGGGMPAPDVSWVAKSRLVGIKTEKFIPVVPDFVIELRSASDNLKPLQAKMLEYQRLGVRFGLLVNPKNRQVEIYRLGQPPELLERPRLVNCDEVLPGFQLDLVWAGIWPELVSSQATEPKVEIKDPLEIAIVLRQLQCKLGKLTTENQARIRVLASDRLLELGDALLFFSSQQDLEDWLTNSMKASGDLTNN